VLCCVGVVLGSLDVHVSALDERGDVAVKMSEGRTPERMLDWFKNKSCFCSMLVFEVCEACETLQVSDKRCSVWRFHLAALACCVVVGCLGYVRESLIGVLFAYP
jgi:hypothetical protein